MEEDSPINLLLIKYLPVVVVMTVLCVVDCRCVSGLVTQTSPHIWLHLQYCVSEQSALVLHELKPRHMLSNLRPLQRKSCPSRPESSHGSVWELTNQILPVR